MRERNKLWDCGNKSCCGVCSVSAFLVLCSRENFFIQREYLFLVIVTLGKVEDV